MTRRSNCPLLVVLAVSVPLSFGATIDYDTAVCSSVGQQVFRINSDGNFSNSAGETFERIDVKVSKAGYSNEEQATATQGSPSTWDCDNPKAPGTLLPGTYNTKATMRYKDSSGNQRMLDVDGPDEGCP